MREDQNVGSLGNEIRGQRYEKAPSIVCKLKLVLVCRFWHLEA